MATAMMLRRHGPWAGVGLLGALALAVLATSRGETVSALWIVVAAVCVYLVAYRYYSRFIAGRVLGLDARRPTPAQRHNDGLDYVPTNRYVLFGHHFAAIAGAGPLVGPVLAAQMGYLPGTLWILFGAVLAGTVQDFIILFISMRRDGRSLGEIVRMEMGPVAGVVALFGTFMIMVIILAVLALIVVRALANSPWGLFTVAATMPLAVVMGLYGRFVRPGRIGEMSLIGVVGLLLAIVYGRSVAESPVLAPLFTWSPSALAWAMIGYGAIAAMLPVWLLLAPRDYLTTFLKVGTILALAIGIVVVSPALQMPALTQFVDGSGPVWSGSLFPFLFITIACGAVSGFHALISSGTTPKLIATEADAPFIGYGGMLMESFVAVMALISASILDPGVYFTMNSPEAVVGTSVESAAAAVTELGFPIAPDTIRQITADVGELSIVSRVGGAPTLAVGMAEIFHQVTGGDGMKAFWYHFAILFEALFILTAVDAGTRAGRFMLQDLIALAAPSFGQASAIGPNVASTLLCVAAWGFFLHQGVTDPLGGVNTLWPLFGIANQMLAAVALTLATVVLFRMKRHRFAWVTGLPAVWLVVCTMTAGWQKIAPTMDPRISFVAHARLLAAKMAEGELLAPARDMAQMQQILLNDRVDAALSALFMVVVATVVIYGVRACRDAYRSQRITAVEIGAQQATA